MDNARIVRLRSRKTGRVKYAVKVGDRAVGPLYGDKLDASRALEAWNARYSHEARVLRDADRARVLGALRDNGPATADELAAVTENDRDRAKAAADYHVRAGRVTKSTRRTTRVITRNWLQPAKHVPTRIVTYAVNTET